MPFHSKSWEAGKRKRDRLLPLPDFTHCHPIPRLFLIPNTLQRNFRIVGSKQSDSSLPGFQCGLKMQRHSLGVLAPSRSKSHRVPGSLAQGFSPAAREPQCLALVLPSLLVQQKQRGWASRRSLPLPVQPPRHACDYSGQEHLRGPRGVTHTKEPCASALQDRQLGRRHRTQAG